MEMHHDDSLPHMDRIAAPGWNVRWQRHQVGDGVMTYERTARLMSGVQPSAGPHYRAVTPRDSLPLFVPQSILPDASLPFRQLSQPMFNKRALIRDAILGGLTGLLLFTALFILVFIET